MIPIARTARKTNYRTGLSPLVAARQHRVSSKAEKVWKPSRNNRLNSDKQGKSNLSVCSLYVLSLLCLSKDRRFKHPNQCADDEVKQDSSPNGWMDGYCKEGGSLRHLTGSKTYCCPSVFFFNRQENRNNAFESALSSLYKIGQMMETK